MRTYSTKSITIPASGSIVQISHKLPGDAIKCTGLAVGCSATNATKALAMVGFGLNNGKDATFTKLVYNKGGKESRMPKAFDPQCDVMPLYATGYVQDLGNASAYPYTVYIHFETDNT